MDIYKVIREKNLNDLDKIAVDITMDDKSKRSYTYRQLFEKSDVYAEKLQQCGIKKGDRVIIVAENSPEWNVSFLSIMKLRCTAVLIDSSLATHDIQKLIEKTDARGIFTTPKVINRFSTSLSKTIPVFNIMNNCELFQNSVDKVSTKVGETIDKDEEVALIIYSSGTTKSASGIMHTHEAMIKTIEMTANENNITSDDRILGVLPNSHIYGVITCLFGSMMLGGSLRYIDSMNSENLLYAFNDFKPTIFPCVPKVFELFEKQIVKKIKSNNITKKVYEIFFPLSLKIRHNFRINLGKIIFKSVHNGFGGNIKLMTSAGAPLDSKVAEFYYGMGFDLLETYGLTETNIPVIGNRTSNLTTNSCGKPYPNIEVKLENIDESGAGEIYIKSPYMMKGYFRDQKSTNESFDGEYFKTGDIAVYDKNQNIKIVGRSKENIVLSTGKKVTPTDIENKYERLIGVKEFVICGVNVKDADYDEVHAFIVKESEQIDNKEIQQQIDKKASELSLYMKIAKVHFVDEIPKTSLQKPKRFLLKKYALENSNIEKIEKSESDSTYYKNTFDILCEIISKIGGFDSRRITSESKVIGELGLDSLSIIELASIIEERYSVDITKYFKDDISVIEIQNIIEVPRLNSENENINKISIRNKHAIHYAIFKIHCFIAYALYKVKIKNSENIPDNTGYIICANHVSNIDYLWITLQFKKNQFKNFCCMAKKELFKDSFINKLLIDVCGMIPVDRGGMNTEVLKCCNEKLKENWGMLIHPEGTRSNDGKLGIIKKGAAKISKEAGVPIIPAYIKGGYEIFPRGNKLPNFFNWKKFERYSVEIVYGDPIYPDKLSIDEITDLLQKSICELA